MAQAIAGTMPGETTILTVFRETTIALLFKEATIESFRGEAAIVGRKVEFEDDELLHA
jgi:hypothetical protein